jgi:hypothetical protein
VVSSYIPKNDQGHIDPLLMNHLYYGGTSIQSWLSRYYIVFVWNTC